MTVDLFSTARRNMVECQLVPGNIEHSAILAALGNLPRELFVPEHLRGSAYIDEELPLGEGRYVLAPLALARLLVLADIHADDVVLHVGAASGYEAAALGQLAATVVAVESHESLAENARKLLSRLHIPNVKLVTAPLVEGYSEDAPYDVIFVNGAIETLPDALATQLAEGGRLIAVRRVKPAVGKAAGLGRAVLYHKQGGRLFSKEAFDLSVPLLSDFEEEKTFEF